MSRHKLRIQDYIGHLEEAISRIQKYIDGMSLEDFLENQLIQDAVIRNFEVIGEASHNIRKHCPDHLEIASILPLQPAYEMRNALAHGYFKIDLTILWRSACIDLVAFQSQIEQVKARLDAEPITQVHTREPGEF